MNVVPVTELHHVDRFLRTFTSRNTRVAYEKDLKDYAAFATGMNPLSFSCLAQYRDLLISSASPATVVRKFAAVKSFLSFLASEGSIPSNPAQNLKVPRSRTQEHTQAFDDEEVSRVVDQADSTTFHGNVHRLVLVLLFSLGLRRSELVNLKLSSIGEHRGRRFLTVIGKGDKSRFVPLSVKVMAEIEAYLARHAEITGSALGRDDYLVQSNPLAKNEKPVNPTTIYRIVKQRAASAGVSKRVSPHSCRATMISHLLEKDVSPRSVADLAGHSSIQTTVGIYDRKRDALSNPAASKVSFL